MSMDSHTAEQSHHDPNSAPPEEQHDDKRPKPIDQERPMETPEVSQRTDHVEYPIDGQIPEASKRDLAAAGFHAIYETAKFGIKHGITRDVISLAVVNQKGGFDCPSCAWPDPDHDRSFAEFCENGAKAVAWESTSKRVTPEFFAKHSIDELAARSEQWLGDQGRITQPMVLRRGSTHYEPIDWADAFKMIAEKLNALADPNEAMFYTSGRASNEAAFVYQLFVRQFGTNNLPDCSNMCHESSGYGLTKSIGIGKGTVKLDDFDKADCIFEIGHNPGTNHPRMLTELEKAVKKNGCKIISINPLIETGLIAFRHPQKPLEVLGKGTDLGCLFLQIKINGDVACIKGIMKEMLEMDEASGGKVLDHKFIAEKTHGFEEFAADLRNTPWDLIVKQSGVPREKIREAAEIAAKSERMITCWAMGITQHANGVGNVQTIANFNLLRGQIGRPGAGVCPVRGHSNVQGDRTVGIWEQMNAKFHDALDKEFNFKSPRKHGVDAIAGIQAMHEGKVKVYFGLGGNLLSAVADTGYTAEAFRRSKLSVCVSIKLNRNHLITGEEALILPCRSRTEKDMQAGGEQFVSCENSMGVVQSSEGVLEPASRNLMSETEIICHLAHATLGNRTTVDWRGLCANYDRIRDSIERVVPGFAEYNRRVRVPGGFYLPNAARDKQEFHTETKKANFFVHPIPINDLQRGQLLMTSIRSHDQFNTTIYGQNDRYRGISGGRRVIFMNADDIRSLGFSDGQWLDITSHYEGQERTIREFKIFPYQIPTGCCATYYPEANPLIPLRHVAEGSNQPASKSIVVTLKSSNSNRSA